MKLEIKHLAPYLPYGLTVYNTHTGCITEMLASSMFYKQERRTELNGGNCLLNVLNSNTEKPILRPMSELNREHPAMLEINGHHSVDFNMGNTFVELDHPCDSDPYSVEWLPYKCFEILLKHHIDVFGLIGQGLAINIHDLEKYI